MSSVQMRSDIRPLCDYHYGAMSPVAYKWQVGTDVFPLAAFRCDELDCHRHYNITHGYFTIAEGRIQRETKVHMPCPGDTLPMYLAEVRAGDEAQRWCCAQTDCTGWRETRNNGQVSSDADGISA